MFAKHKRVTILALAVTLLIAATALLAPASESPLKSACAAYSSAADAFLAKIGGESRLTYDVLGELSTPVRRRVVSRVSPDVKSHLWLTHFERFRSDHPNLNNLQRRILERAAFMAAPATFIEIAASEYNLDSGALTEMKAFNDEALAVFSRDEVWALFFELGPGAGDSPAALTIDGEEGSLLFGEDCDCAPWWGCLAVPQDCEETWECDETTFGCGFLWGNPCIGACEWSVDEPPTSGNPVDPR